MRFWIKSWSDKEETLWETCLENMARAFLDYYMEAEDNVPQILRKELLRENGNSETTAHCQRGWRTVCATGLRIDKDMGNFGAYFWLIAWWGVREVLLLIGEQDCSQ